jgi:co-chaperonin GroES (HSP10)
MPMQHDVDPKVKILTEIGDLSQVEIFHGQVLLAVYLRPTKTKSGLILTDDHVDEDRYQSKVGLLVKSGPQAFIDDGKWFSGVEISQHDWLVFRPSDGWSITVNNVLCRIFEDVSIKGRVSDPDQVY